MLVALEIALHAPESLSQPAQFPTLRELVISTSDFKILEIIHAPNLEILTLATNTFFRVNSYRTQQSLGKAFAKGSGLTLAPRRLNIPEAFRPPRSGPEASRPDIYQDDYRPLGGGHFTKHRIHPGAPRGWDRMSKT